MYVCMYVCNWVWSSEEATFLYYLPLRSQFSDNIGNLKPLANVYANRGSLGRFEMGYQILGQV